MAARSTRDRMRWNVWKASDRIEQAQGSLRHVEELAEGRSQIVNENLAQIILTLEACRQALLAFRDEL